MAEPQPKRRMTRARSRWMMKEAVTVDEIVDLSKRTEEEGVSALPIEGSTICIFVEGH